MMLAMKVVVPDSHQEVARLILAKVVDLVLPLDYFISITISPILPLAGIYVNTVERVIND